MRARSQVNPVHTTNIEPCTFIIRLNASYASSPLFIFRHVQPKGYKHFQSDLENAVFIPEALPPGPA